MKCWSDVICENLSYEEACRYIKNYPGAAYITRKGREAIYFYHSSKRSKLTYYSLKADGQIVKDPVVYCKYKNDWMIVTISKAAAKTLHEHRIIKSAPAFNLRSRWDNKKEIQEIVEG